MEVEAKQQANHKARGIGSSNCHNIAYRTRPPPKKTKGTLRLAQNYDVWHLVISLKQ